MIKVTFSAYSEIQNKWFTFSETHKNEADIRLRAAALNWMIGHMETEYRGWKIEGSGGKFYASIDGATYGPFPSIQAAKDAIYRPINY